ncbi:hypothetical protein HDU98_004492, partial [Podochytrium sp. JEL0797]
MAEELSYLIIHRYEGEYLHPPTTLPPEPSDAHPLATRIIPIPAEPTEICHQPDPTSTSPPIATDPEPISITDSDEITRDFLITTARYPSPPRSSISIDQRPRGGAPTQNDPTEPHLFHGNGSIEFNSGHKYTGEFRTGFMQGRGEFVWRDGVCYVGDFEDNKITGSGEYTWKSSGARYEGEVRDGLRCGVGHFVAGARGAEFWGEWRDGMLNGAGKLVYNKAGTCFYEGTWLNDLKHGKGDMHYESGNVYSGNWVNNVKQGKGKMVWFDRGEEYEGDWENGMPHGTGVYTWKVVNSKDHQLPMYNTYNGEWHGQGSCIYENGRVFTGEFSNERPVTEAPKFQNDYPFVFNLKGLQPDPTLIEESIKVINNVILRHTNDLRKVYSYYCNLGAVATNQANAINNRAVTRIQLWKFFCDCKLKDKGFSFVELDRTCVAHLKDDPIFNHLYEDPHNVSRHFIFRDFLDVILRISHKIYGTQTPDLSIHEHGVAAAFSHFIKADVIPNAKEASGRVKEVVPDEVGQQSEELVGSENGFAKQLFQDIEQEYSDGIYRLYSSLAAQNSRKTVSIRMLLHFLNDAKMIDTIPTTPNTLPTLPISQFIHHVANHCIPGVVVTGDSYNLEFELVPYEMFATLYDCLHYKTLG